MMMISAGVLAVAAVLTAVAPLGHLPDAQASESAGDVVLTQQYAQGYHHIVYRKADGSETTLTSFDKDQAEFPDVAAGGSRIAFDDALYSYNSSGQVSGGGDGIWVMNSDGSGQTQLTFPDVTAAATSPANFADTAPRWSPDGTRLVFVRRVYDPNTPGGGVYRIFVMNADGTAVTDLTPAASDDNFPAWSPDGSQIAYIGYDANGDGSVWVMNADGTNAHPVDPPSACTAEYLDWASNNRIYAWRSCTGEMYLGFLTSDDGFADAAHSTETDLTPRTGTGSLGNVEVAGLRASADGNTVYFTMGGGSTVYDYSVQNGWALTQVTSGESDMWPTPVKVGAAAGSFTVVVDDSAVGSVFGSVPAKPVLDDQVAPPSEACRSGWEVSVTNNSAVVLDTPTNGNVTGKRIDVPSWASGFLLPGQTGSYCVAFTGLNQVFDVLYDVSNPLARAADGGYLLADALGLPLDDGTSLFTFIAAVIAIPQMRQVGACLGTGNLFCAVQAVRVLTANAKATDALLSAIRDYEVALGSSIAPDLLKKLSPKWLAKHLSEELFKVLTTGSWVLQFGGQVAFSPAGYVAFDTVPSP